MREQDAQTSSARSWEFDRVKNRKLLAGLSLSTVVVVAAEATSVALNHYV